MVLNLRLLFYKLKMIVSDPVIDEHNNITIQLSGDGFTISVTDTRNTIYEEEEEEVLECVQTYFLSFAVDKQHVNIETAYLFFRILEKLGICSWSEFKCLSKPDLHWYSNSCKTYCPGSRSYTKDENEIRLLNRSFMETAPFYPDMITVSLHEKWLDKDVKEVAEKIVEASKLLIDVSFIPNLLFFKYQLNEEIEVTPETNFAEKDKEIWSPFKDLKHKPRISNHEVDQEILDYYRFEKKEHMDKETLIKMYNSKDLKYVDMYIEAILYEIENAVM